MRSLQRGGLGCSMASAAKSVGLLDPTSTSSPSLGGTPRSKKSNGNDSATSRGRVACRGEHALAATKRLLGAVERTGALSRGRPYPAGRIVVRAGSFDF